MEKRIGIAIDDKAAETKKVTQEVLSKSLEAVKYDYETIINRLGQQVQELVTRVKQEHATALSTHKRDHEDQLWQLKSSHEDTLKSHKSLTSDEVQKAKEESRLRLEDSEKRNLAQFARMLDEASKTIED